MYIFSKQISTGNVVCTASAEMLLASLNDWQAQTRVCSGSCVPVLLTSASVGGWDRSVKRQTCFWTYTRAMASAGQQTSRKRSSQRSESVPHWTCFSSTCPEPWSLVRQLLVRGQRQISTAQPRLRATTSTSAWLRDTADP